MLKVSINKDGQVEFETKHEERSDMPSGAQLRLEYTGVVTGVITIMRRNGLNDALIEKLLVQAIVDGFKDLENVCEI